MVTINKRLKNYEHDFLVVIFQTPNTKHQTPNTKRQTPNAKDQTLKAKG
ncbi:MAG: hypothetical protein WA775_04960 [Psychroserpens sp.]